MGHYEKVEPSLPDGANQKTNGQPVPNSHQLKHGAQERVLRRLSRLAAGRERYGEAVGTLIATKERYFARHSEHLTYAMAEHQG